MFDGKNGAKAYNEAITLSKNISLIDTNSNFVDIDYIINLVYDLDLQGLLYLRYVVEDLIEK